MHYWIFKANPEKYNLEGRMRDPLRLISWRVNEAYRSGVAIGDVAFIFRTGPQRGIVGVLRVASEPCRMEEIETERRYCLDLPLGAELRVLGEITHRCASVIMVEKLRPIESLNGLSIFPENDFQQKTTFPVKKEEAVILMSLVESQAEADKSVTSS